MRMLRARFSVGDLAGISEVSAPRASQFVRELERGGYVRRDASDARPATFTLLRNPGPRAPEIIEGRIFDPNLPLNGGRSARQRMWTWMRRPGRIFNKRELAAAVGAEPEHVRQFAFALERGGYLRRTASGRNLAIVRTGRHLARWELVRDSGPLAPRIAMSGQVVDLNVLPTRAA